MSEMKFISSSEHQNSEKININKLEKILNQKYEELIATVNEISELHNYSLEQNDSLSVQRLFFRDLEKLYQTKGYGFYFYKNNALTYWTTNDIPVPVSTTIHFFDEAIIYLNNGWYMCYSLPIEDNHIVGLFQIKKEYSFDNDNLNNDFWCELGINSNLSIEKDSVNQGQKVCFNIQNNENVCFYLIDVQNILQNNCSNYFTAKHASILLQFIIALILIILIFIYFIKKYPDKNLLCFIVLAIFLVTARFLLLHFNYFESFFIFYFFSPKLFANYFWLPSLGEFSVSVLFFLIYSILVLKYLQIANQKPQTAYRISKISILIPLIIFLITKFISDLFYDIVCNSIINLEFDKLLNLNIYSYIATLLIVVTIICFVLILYKLFKNIKNQISFKAIAVLLFIIFVIDIIFLNFDKLSISLSTRIITSTLFYILWIFLLYTALNNKNKYYIKILFLVIISLITSEYFSRLSSQKELDIYKVIAYNLAAERDANAEFFIKQVDDEIKNDTEINENINNRNFNKITEKINTILLSKRYFNKYETQITICSNLDSLIVKPDFVSVDCFDFFDTQIQQFAVLIPNTDFYFLDNHNGRISYIGKISKQKDTATLVNIYIELNSKIFSEGLGYPELLLDKKNSLKKNSKDYSYAKYNNNSLITSHGDYNYRIALKAGINDTADFISFEQNGYIHYKYKPDNDNIIIISKPNTQFSSELFSFTYIFTFLLIAFNLIWIIKNIINRKIKKIDSSIIIKTQISYVSILVLSLITVGIISIYFIIRTYQQKQKNILEDKIHSVLVELERAVGYESKLDYKNSEYLKEFLIDLSNIFYSDINIYNLDGILFSSSRVELYDKGLKGRYMSSNAYNDMIRRNSGIMIYEEKIEKIKYLSAYVPLRDYNNQTIAYVNLPYFARQSEIDAEIFNYIMAFFNIFLIFVLLLVVAGIFISRQLTRPLTAIKNKLKTITLEGKNEKINYSKEDEIGTLINEYNKKVDELQESAEKLAKSQRESAWREMAKQIAHEIKNPLTPMKLSVQFLEKSYDLKDSDFENKFKKVIKTLIEQINTLSEIATQFSNFAQISDTKLEKIDLKEIIENSVLLFNANENIDFSLNFNKNHTIYIHGDKDQMLRVFNNLINNGIQAIPKDRQGIIKISVSENSDNYLISIVDNGTGISEDIREKIFEPNFTTKNTGMGLGLSMVKNILKNHNANIHFKTNVDICTEFLIDIPKYYEL